jgi:microcystin-dependent protein
MSCSNCYNGCTEIVSDKCVKYTGVDVPALGIEKGDPLSVVEQSLIEFLTSALDGTGIILTIDPEIICEVVNKYLPVCAECTTLNALDLFKALIQAACDLQAQVDVIVAQLAALEGDYDVECLEGVTAGSGTHDILQATITKLCEVDADLAALAIDVDTNYVKLADLDDLIQAYLDSISPIDQQYLKMVPYTAVEYYGPLTNFDGAGKGIAGLGWDKIYLCNGQPGTPDKRGRIGVGVTTGVPGGAMSPVVDPAVPGNPTYSLYSVNGTNNVTLTTPQIPAHTHTTTSLPVDHTHFMFGANPNNAEGQIVTAADNVARARAISGQELDYEMMRTALPSTLGKTSSASITANVSVNNAGGGQAHTNIPPVLATNYIIYLP